MSKKQRMFNPRMERLPRRQLEKLQLKRLRAAVRRAYRNVPFYRENFTKAGVSPADLKTLDDIAKFPFSTKDDLRAAYPYQIAGVPLSYVVEMHASSGTTGVPAVALHTAHDVDVWAEISARSLVMSGLTKDDVFQITPSFGLFSGGFGFYHGARKVGAFIVPAGAGFSQRQIQFMRDLGTTMICAIVSYALRLAEVAQQMGLDPARDTKVRKGVFGSEIWTKEMKRKIADIWDMDVYDIYGFTELFGPGVANDCHLHNGLHVWEDHLLVEVVDPKTGETLPPEQEGELVFTHLTKEALPLVRFRSRDLAFLYDDANCDCGRTHARISPIKGRVDDMIKVSGVSVWPTQIETVLMKFPEAGTEYQVIVTRRDSVDHMRVAVESKENLDDKKKEDLASRLLTEIRNVLNLTPELQIVDPGTLPRIEIGKAKRIVDERSQM